MIAPLPEAVQRTALAPLAELVDARDSKSRSFTECRFDSGGGHHFYLRIAALKIPIDIIFCAPRSQIR